MLNREKESECMDRDNKCPSLCYLWVTLTIYVVLYEVGTTRTRGYIKPAMFYGKTENSVVFLGTTYYVNVPFTLCSVK